MKKIVQILMNRGQTFCLTEEGKIYIWEKQHKSVGTKLRYRHTWEEVFKETGWTEDGQLSEDIPF